MPTQSKNGRRNGGRKKSTPTPDLIGALGKKRGPGRPPKHTPAPTADQIADSIDTEIEKLKGLRDILRGKA